MILTREQAIDKLIEHDMETIRHESNNWEQSSEYLRDLLRYGFMGYSTMENEFMQIVLKRKCNQEIEIV